MSHIPDHKKYKVKLGTPANNWADGDLLDPNPGTGVVTYKGVNVTNFDPDEHSVSWDVTLTHGANDCALQFSLGVYSSSTTKITGGKVIGPCLVALTHDNSDSWSADQAPGAEGDKERHKRKHKH